MDKIFLNMNLEQQEWWSKYLTDVNGVILDVRTEDEVNNGKIPGSLNFDIYKGQGFVYQVDELDKAKKSIIVPLFCPKCKKVMNKGMDPSYYLAVDQCFKCFKKFETQLKVTGLWEEWSNRTINGNIDSFITWYKDWVMDAINTSNNSFVSEQGDVEKWVGGVNKKKALEALNKTIAEWEKARK
mgnify:CR=1 FL=1